MSEHISKRIDDLFELKQGKYCEAEKISEIRTNEAPFAHYGANGVTGYVAEKMYEVRLPLISCRGANCGVIHFSQEESWINNNSIACIPKEGCDPTFFYHQFKRFDFADVISGAAQPQITLSNLRHKQFWAPPLPTQRSIAAILSAYDDLIENNRRRIHLLEESARQLYREWFVHLRFPGHQHTPIHNGIPEGWSRKTLRELSESVRYGFTASATREPDGPRFLRITDIVPSVINWETVPYCPISEKDFPKFELQTGDIVVARTGATVGFAKRIGKLNQPAVFASYLVRLRLDGIDDLIGGIFAESDEFKSYIRNNAGGAAQPNANAQVIAGAELLVPTLTIQKLFRETVEPTVQSRDILQQQIQKLAKARDHLLPKLMSGEIAV